MDESERIGYEDTLLGRQNEPSEARLRLKQATQGQSLLPLPHYKVDEMKMGLSKDDVLKMGIISISSPPPPCKPLSARKLPV